MSSTRCVVLIMFVKKANLVSACSLIGQSLSLYGIFYGIRLVSYLNVLIINSIFLLFTPCVRLVGTSTDVRI